MQSAASAQDKYGVFDCLIACDVLASINLESSNKAERDLFLQQYASHYIFNVLSYDLKNVFETSLYSENKDFLDSPGSFWIVYRNVIKLSSNQVEINSSESKEEFIWQFISNSAPKNEEELSSAHSVKLNHRTNKETYLNDIASIQEAIRCGSVYELNYCQEFYAADVEVNPLAIYKKMLKANPAPFSVFFKLDAHYLMGASPERFLAKRGNTLIAQPIKGTKRRLSDEALDELQKNELRQCEKERAENVMIVDLMRNDLARCCEVGSIQVEELFGIYSFATVHQMISTVSGKLKPNISFEDVLQNTFPMGSMTGAPKIESMKLIEQFETVKRGWFSGSIGYIAPNGDFDLNVVIRSLIYNADKKYLSLQTGGAITIDSVAEKEYEESLLKAEAWMRLLA